MKKIEKLAFVFDANSGKLAALADSLKKALSMNGCALCTITHGIFGEKGSWKECKEKIGVPIDYVHRDEIPPEVARAAAEHYPCIVARTVDGVWGLVVGPDALAECKGDAATLTERIYARAKSQDMELPEILIEA